jgi:hypothetical protein
MRKTSYFCVLFLSLILGTSSMAQNNSGADSTGLPGDNFSLHGALQMFQNASSPEEFEKMINSEGNNVNNLDLNEDGDIDYVRVIDKMDKDIHAFVLQVPVSEKENQDIAVIELEKTGDASAVIQIIGDEDIYGEQVIVEPAGGEADGSFIGIDDYSIQSGPNPGYYNTSIDIVVNVWLWPTVRYVYAPAYTIWVSPWRWRVYPTWWRPWRPLAWHVFHPRRVHFHRPFVIVHTHRVIRAHRIYTPFRASAVSVRTRHSASVNNYRVTRTRTTVTGPRGNTVTKKTTTVTGKQGKVKATKTRVKRN